MRNKIAETKGDVGAMKQFVVLGIFILIGVIVYANIYGSAGYTTTTGADINASFHQSDFYAGVFDEGAYMVTSPAVVVYVAGTVVNGATSGSATNYTIDYTTGNLTIWNTTATAGGGAITADYSFSATGTSEGRDSINSLNTTWYNSVDLLIIVFLVIAAVVILAYVGRIGGGQ